ncbi:hypothetical protein SEA_JAMZY_57 [Gordonia phage Jamzy]|nr:hypothetical protein SEA_JAMZY_57 [Gordonia phage Jamzy]
MSMTEAARLRQQRRRAERRANPRPGDLEARKEASKRRWHEKRKHDAEYRTHRVNGTRERRWKLFGGSQQLFDQLWEAQDGLCAICSHPMNLPSDRKGDKRTREACFDHCHKKMVPRGLLCLGCNVKLGWLENYESAIQNYRKEY